MPTDDGYQYFRRTHPIHRADPLTKLIAERYRDTHDGAEPKDPAIRHVLWRLMFERSRFPTLEQATAQWQAHADNQTAATMGAGLRHDWRKARAAWLYPGTRKYWLASQRMMRWPNATIDAYLDLPMIKQHTTHVIVCCSTGKRPEMLEEPFNALKHPDRMKEVFEKIINADKAPIAWLMSQEFFKQELRGNHKKLLDQLRYTAELVQDVGCAFMVGFRELGEIYGHNDLDKRSAMMKAMRRGAPDIPVAVHERGLVEIPVSDFQHVDGDCISLLQTSFRCPTGGDNKPKDRVTSPSGHHVYDGAAGFIQANHDRMKKWEQQGRMERHTNAVGEHSIPSVFPGQPWKPTRSFASAQKRGAKLLKHGAAFDLSGAAKA
jgi:hypothetical protein